MLKIDELWSLFVVKLQAFGSLMKLILMQHVAIKKIKNLIQKLLKSIFEKHRRKYL